jgi:hypothetical protein
MLRSLRAAGNAMGIWFLISIMCMCYSAPAQAQNSDNGPLMRADSQRYCRDQNHPDAVSCWAVAQLYPSSSYSKKEGDQYPRAAFLTNECNGGHFEACTLLGLKYANSSGENPNWELIDGLYDKACGGNEPVGCFLLGLHKRSESAVRISLYRKSCQLSFQHACAEVASLQSASAGDRGRAPAPAPRSYSDFPNRAEVIFRGNYAMNQTVPSSGRTRQYSGFINFTVTINGESVSAVMTGNSLVSVRLSGTMFNGVCNLNGTSRLGTASYNGRCGKNGFSGTMGGRNNDGASYRGEFETSSVSVADLDVRDRQQAEAAALRQKQQELADANARREAAILAAKPAASPALARALEAAVRQDSGAWNLNRYDRGSLQEVKLLSSGRTSRIRGNYTFNGGSSGWVEADVSAGKVQCLAYWDVGSCEEVRTPANNAGASQDDDPRVRNCHTQMVFAYTDSTTGQTIMRPEQICN